MSRILTALFCCATFAFAQTEGAAAEGAGAETVEEKPAYFVPPADNALPPGRCKVMVIVTKRDPENNIYSHALHKMSMDYEMFQSDDMTEAMQRLDEFDLVMTGLNLSLTDDLAPYTDAFKDWVERGGGFCVFDGCNGAWYTKFVEAITGGLTMHPTRCAGANDRVTYGWIKDVDPVHPLRSFPLKVDFECAQWHCLHEIEGWDIVSTCSGPGKIHPVTVIRNQGRGFVYVSSMQQRWSSVASDLRCYLACSRLGLKFTRSRRPELTPTKQRMFMRFTPLWGSGAGKAVLSIAQGEKEKQVGKKFVKIKGSEDVGVMIPFELEENSEVNLTMNISTSEGSASIPLVTGKVKPHLAVRGPRYRNVLSISRRVKNVMFIVNAHPLNGRTPADKVTLTVVDPQNKQLAQKTIDAGDDKKKTEFEISVELPMELAASKEYKVMSKFMTKGKIYTAENKFEVRGNEHVGGVIMDEDMTMLVDGKPFFPLVIYHLHMDQYKDIIPVGFNTVTTFQWLSRNNESFLAAEELGLKVFFENNEKHPGGFNYMPNFYKNRPSFLMWYLPDEPLHEKDADLSYAVAKILDNDPFHPKTVVHYNAPRFAQVQEGADIMAPDMYYIGENKSPEQQNYAAYATTCDYAHEAVKRQKPVMQVVGAFGHENKTDLMMTAFLPIVRGARGLMWYAWDERNGSQGLVYYPESQQYITEVIAEVKKVIPAILHPRRRSFTEPIFVTEASGDENAPEVRKDTGKKLYIMVCGTSRAGTAIIVNPSEHPVANPPIKEAMGKKITSVFENDNLKELIQPFSVRAFKWRAKAGASKRKR